MVQLRYDATFEGLLTAVFDVYEYKYSDVMLARDDGAGATIFEQYHTVHSSRQKSNRVWKGLLNYISYGAATGLYHAWLSELPGIEETLLRYMRYVFDKKENIEADYSHPAVLTVVKTARKVLKEKHRMEAFVRFQLTGDGLYYAVVEPDFNVLPLLAEHFGRRYADQRWLIYDARRRYGIHYDGENVSYVQLSFEEHGNGKNIARVYDEKEMLYQTLWQKYFGSVNIAARKNKKLQLQHMPRRYWKYLPEKS